MPGVGVCWEHGGGHAHVSPDDWSKFVLGCREGDYDFNFALVA